LGPQFRFLERRYDALHVKKGESKMSEQSSRFGFDIATSQEQTAALVEKLFDVARPGVVFGEPTTSGEYTVITASDIRVGMGFGYGGGSGTGPAEEEGQEAPIGMGSGGAGGGASGGRPVAVISIGPDGVQVEPVVDATRIALALFTTLGSMFLMFRKMAKTGKR
jgi:uncharacterized spore protein YtfJ